MPPAPQIDTNTDADAGPDLRSATAPPRSRRGIRAAARIPAFAIAAAPWLLVAVHAALIVLAMQGLAGIRSELPPARHDHPLYFHSALATREFLADSGSTAGYDPAFMAGYPKSVVFPASSTLPELVVAAGGLVGLDPAIAYKLHVLFAAASPPLWILLAARAARLANPAATAILAVALFLVYLWTDFPINYAEFGMLPYLLAVPLALAATLALARSLETETDFEPDSDSDSDSEDANANAPPPPASRPRPPLRLPAAAMLSLAPAAVVLVHFTVLMVAVPAVLAAWIVAVVRARRPGAAPVPWSGHLAVWFAGPLAVALNAFWWLPGIVFAETKGPSDFAFSHSRESVLARLFEIVATAPPILPILTGFGLVGLAVLLRRRPVVGAALAGFAAAGFFWGYLAAWFPSLDFLQPGRHTYACFSAAAVAAAVALVEILRTLRPAPRTETGAEAAHASPAPNRARPLRLDRWVAAALLLVAVRLFLPGLDASLRARVFAERPMLASLNPPRWARMIDQLRARLQPGDRLLYEEGGFEVPGAPEPFQAGRYSGLLPHFLPGVELLGGPYLHASLVNNFTQFGEGALFQNPNWDREFFDRHARIYRPTAILCWSPRARAFCLANPDRVRVLEDDGVLLLGRVLGFEGPLVEAPPGLRAEVESAPGRLVVTLVAPPGVAVDSPVVLRYHHAPSLRIGPDAAADFLVEPATLEDDPVPFLALRPREHLAGADPRSAEAERRWTFPVALDPWPRLRARP